MYIVVVSSTCRGQALMDSRALSLGEKGVARWASRGAAGGQECSHFYQIRKQKYVCRVV